MPGRMSARGLELSQSLRKAVEFSRDFVRTTGGSMSESKDVESGLRFSLTHYYCSWC